MASIDARVWRVLVDDPGYGDPYTRLIDGSQTTSRRSGLAEARLTRRLPALVARLVT
jgi:hypothetical protein